MVSLVQSHVSTVISSVSDTGDSLKDKVSSFAKRVFEMTIGRVWIENPVTKKRELWVVPESVEVMIGKSLFTSQVQKSGGLCEDARYNELVKRVGQRLADVSDRKLPYEFVVVNNDESINAWAMPGGKIAIHTALLKKMEESADDEFTLEDKVAAVLGHEIIHAAARHTARSLQLAGILYLAGRVIMTVAERILFNKRPEESDAEFAGRKHTFGLVSGLVSKVVLGLFRLSHTRGHELEADRYGMYYMERAGFNPGAAVWLQEMFAESKKGSWEKVTQYASSHPASSVRVAANQETLTEILTKRGGDR